MSTLPIDYAAQLELRFPQLADALRIVPNRIAAWADWASSLDASPTAWGRPLASCSATLWNDLRVVAAVPCLARQANARLGILDQGLARLRDKLGDSDRGRAVLATYADKLWGSSSFWGAFGELFATARLTRVAETWDREQPGCKRPKNHDLRLDVPDLKMRLPIEIKTIERDEPPAGWPEFVAHLRATLRDAGITEGVFWVRVAERWWQKSDADQAAAARLCVLAVRAARVFRSDPTAEFPKAPATPSRHRWRVEDYKRRGTKCIEVELDGRWAVLEPTIETVNVERPKEDPPVVAGPGINIDVDDELVRGVLVSPTHAGGGLEIVAFPEAHNEAFTQWSRASIESLGASYNLPAENPGPRRIRRLFDLGQFPEHGPCVALLGVHGHRPDVADAALAFFGEMVLNSETRVPEFVDGAGGDRGDAPVTRGTGHSLRRLHQENRSLGSPG